MNIQSNKASKLLDLVLGEKKRINLFIPKFLNFIDFIDLSLNNISLIKEKKKMRSYDSFIHKKVD